MNRVRRILEIDRIHQMGIMGEGIGVAILDSGISAHPDLKKRTILFRDFVQGKKQPYDDEGHGTHVAGIIAGEGSAYGGRMKGVAPGAKLISLKVLDGRGIGKEECVMEGIRWIIDNGKKYHIRVVNISFGTFGRKDANDNKLVDAVELLWDLGYVVVAAAGNNGPGYRTIATPGDSKKIITVGAANDNIRMVVNGKIKTNYSGRGPTFECIQKPDIVAPANGIYSCCNLWQKGYYYIAKSGTSMATPIVSGIVCLLLSQQKYLTNVECKKILKSTATDLRLDGNRQGWGIVNPRQALNFIRN